MVKVKLLVFVVIGTVLLILSGISPAQQGNETAMERMVIADELARNWSVNASLSNVYVYGSSGSIRYTYTDPNTLMNQKYLIFNDGDFKIHSQYVYPSNIIENWTIDSDEVPAILNNNDTFKGFLEESPDARGSLELHMEDYKTNPTWSFHYSQWYGIKLISDSEVANGCRGKIDANTGEILEIELFGEKISFFWQYSFCIALVIILAILIFYLLVRYNKSCISTIIKEKEGEQEKKVEDDAINTGEGG